MPEALGWWGITVWSPALGSWPRRSRELPFIPSFLVSTFSPSFTPAIGRHSLTPLTEISSGGERYA